MNFKNYYYILGIQPNATKQEIKVAYRKLSLKFHPDTNNDDKFLEEMFRNIDEAYKILLNPEKRKIYDASFNTSTDALNREESSSTDEEVGQIKQRVNNLIDLIKEYFDKEKISNDKRLASLEANNSPIANYLNIKNALFSCLIIFLLFAFVKPQNNNLSSNIASTDTFKASTKEPAKIYAKPDKESLVIATLPAATGINKLEETKYFFKVQFVDNTGNTIEGYIRKKYLRNNDETNITEDNTTNKSKELDLYDKIESDKINFSENIDGVEIDSVVPNNDERKVDEINQSIISYFIPDAAYNKASFYSPDSTGARSGLTEVIYYLKNDENYELWDASKTDGHNTSIFTRTVQITLSEVKMIRSISTSILGDTNKKTDYDPPLVLLKMPALNQTITWSNIEHHGDKPTKHTSSWTNVVINGESRQAIKVVSQYQEWNSKSIDYFVKGIGLWKTEISGENGTITYNKLDSLDYEETSR